jgi:glycosyltransferase involved in cell wall biosynthesis
LGHGGVPQITLEWYDYGMNVALVLPAYNEAQILATSVTALVAFCRTLPHQVTIIIANNGSTDETAAIADRLAAENADVVHLLVAQRGKGAAIRAGWESTEADVYCFMDADLATDLAAVPRLLDGVTTDHDLVIGSRALPESVVQRTIVRRVVSRVYQLLAQAITKTRVHDLPCGFKAVSPRVIHDILSQVQHQGWFMDSELVIRSERAGLRILEIPVQWHDPREGADKSRVQVVRLGWEYFRQLWRLRA